MALHLISAGSNYAGEGCALPDCESDILKAAETFERYCKTVTCLIGAKSARSKQLSALDKLWPKTNSGDCVLAGFSGHGTTEIINGKSVQAILCHDLRLIYEHELRAAFANRPPGVMLISLVDACYSGGLAKGRNRGQPRSVNINSCFRHETELPTRNVKKPNATYAACRAGEVAYSTGVGGAMTLAFLEAFAERTIKTTLPALHKAIQKRLPTAEWPQHPVASFDATMKKRTLKSFVEAA